MKITITFVGVMIVLMAAGCTSVEEKWMQTKQDGSMPAFEKFLEENPEGIFADSAHLALDSIAFSLAVGAPTVDSLYAYLRKYPEGRYLDSAQSGLLEDAAVQMLEEKSFAGYTRIIGSFVGTEFASVASMTLDSIKIDLLSEELRTNILAYFNAGVTADSTSPAAIATFEGYGFDKLLHGMYLTGAGGFRIDSYGRAIADAGSQIQAKMTDPDHREDTKLTVHGKADGKGGFAQINSIEITDGVTVITMIGDVFVYGDGGWQKK